MATGDFGSVIDTLDYQAVDGNSPRLFHVAGEIYLVGDRDGPGPYRTIVRSFSVDAAGNISNSVIDSLVLYSNASAGSPPGEFALVAGDVYAAAYVERTGGSVVVATFTCDSSGNLGAAVIDTILLAAAHENKSLLPHIRKVTGNVFVVTYCQGGTNDGWMKTITINDDGTIDEPELDSWEWQSIQGLRAYLLFVSGTHYLMITASGSSNLGAVMQVNITDAGVISQIAGTPVFDGYQFNGGMVLHVSGDVYAIFYGGGPNNNYGMVATVTCNFVDSPSNIDSWEYYSGAMTATRAVEVSENQAGNGKVFAVPTGPGLVDVDQLHTIEVLNDGTITKTVVDSKQIAATGYVYTPDILRVGTGIYLIGARGVTTAKQTLYTIDIEEAVAGEGGGGVARALVNSAFI